MKNKNVNKTAGDKFLEADEVEEQLRSGIMAARYLFPYLAPAIQAMNPVLTTMVPTMGVDKHFRMYVNPGFVEEIVQQAKDISPTNPCHCGKTSHKPVAYVAGVVLHEVSHLLRDHHHRASERGVMNMLTSYVWNIAADMEINDDLVEMFPTITQGDACLPPMRVTGEGSVNKNSCWTPGVMKYPDGKLAEEYYALLREEYENRVKKMQDCQTCGGTGKPHKQSQKSESQEGQGGQESQESQEGQEGQEGQERSEG